MSHLTHGKLLERFEYYVLQLENQLLKGEDFRDMTDHIPFITILSRPETIKIIHTNKTHEELTGYSWEEVREDCPNYLESIVHPLSLKNVRSFLPDFYAKQSSHQIMAFVQYAKLRGKQDYSPLITFTKPPKSSDSLVIRLCARPMDMGKMSKKMERIVEIDRFKMNCFKRFQQLTDREIEVLTLLAGGHNNPQIADQLFVSRQTVETHRKNIKAKLGLRSFHDLMKYALAFDLVRF